MKKRDIENNKNRKTGRRILTILAIGIGLLLIYEFLLYNTDFLKYLIKYKAPELGNIYVYGEDRTPEERSEKWVFYNALSDEDKNVYSMFLDLVEHRDEEGYVNAIVVVDDGEEKMEEFHLWDVFYTMCNDHPEYFFLYTEDDPVKETYTYYGRYTVHEFSMNIPGDKIEKQIKELEAAKDAFLKDIDLNASDSEIELQIHDKLIDTVQYDYDLYEKMFSEEFTAWDLGFTAYGALVHDDAGNNNYAVCAGYSYAFEYLMHEAGIPCTVLSGNASDESGKEPENQTHSWNLIYVDGSWYEVDTTWDDFGYDYIEPEYQEFYELLRKEEETFYNRRHHFYNKTTKQMENLPAGESVFYIEGYDAWESIGDTHHVRNTDDYTDRYAVFTNNLAPVAE